MEKISKIKILLYIFSGLVSITIALPLTHGSMWILEFGRENTNDYPFAIEWLINNFWLSLILFIVFGLLTLICGFLITREKNKIIEKNT